MCYKLGLLDDVIMSGEAEGRVHRNTSKQVEKGPESFGYRAEFPVPDH